MFSAGKKPFKPLGLMKYHRDQLVHVYNTKDAKDAAHLDPDTKPPKNVTLDEAPDSKVRSIEDYYASEGAGKWFGGGAARLNLEGKEITSAEFGAIACGYKPDGTPIAENAGDPKRDAAYDCAFTAPKSVSVLWGTTNNLAKKAAIEAAMDAAVEKSLSALMEKIPVRVRRNGKIVFKKAEGVAALFTHGTNRSAEPNLHKHAVIFNVGTYGNDQWAGINAYSIFNDKKLTGAMFRVALAEELQKVGFVVERDGESFKLVDVPEKVCKTFSTPREKILKEFRDNPELVYSAAAAEVVNQRLRDKKNYELTPEELIKDWQSVANLMGFSADEYIRDNDSRERPEIVEPTAEQLLRDATQYKAVLSGKELETHIWQACQGVCSYERTMKLVEEVREYAVKVEMKDRPEAETNKSWRRARKEMFFASPDLVLIERDIAEQAAKGKPVGILDVRLANEAIDRFETEGRKKFNNPEFRLNDQQREAVRHLTSSNSSIGVLVGDAGTGKSTSLKCVVDAYQREGYTVYGAAIASKIKNQLHNDLGIEAMVLKKVENDLKSGKLALNSKSVLICDEAGMIDSRQMGRIVKACEEAGAKLILVGDHKQLQPVEAGATFRHIAELAGHAQLSEIIRQRDERDRQAVRQLSAGEAGEAMRSYIERGHVKLVSIHEKAIAYVAEKAVANISEVGAEKSTVLASTNKTVNELNTAIRERMVADGKITDVRKVEYGREKPPFTPLGETPKPFKPGPKRFIELGIGDRIVVTQNDRATELSNGQFGAVEGFNTDGTVQIKFDDAERSRAYDLTEIQLQRGFASTTHKSQGVTVERCLVFGTADLCREMTYVQASRARGDTDFVFTTTHVNKLGNTVEPTETMKRALDAINEARTAAGKEALYIENPAISVTGQYGEEELVPSYTQVNKLLKTHAARWAPEHIQTDLKLEQLKDIVSAMSKSKQSISTLDVSIIDPGLTGLKPGVDKGLAAGVENSQQAVASAKPVYPTPNPYPRVRISGAGIPDPTVPAAPAAPTSVAKDLVTVKAEALVATEARDPGLGARISETFLAARDRLLEFVEQAKRAALARNAEKEAQKARLLEDEAKLAAERDATLTENSPARASAPTGLHNWNAGEQKAAKSAGGSVSVSPEASAAPAPVRRPGMGMGRTSTATRTVESEQPAPTQMSTSQRMVNIDREPEPSPATRTRTEDREK